MEGQDQQSQNDPPREPGSEPPRGRRPERPRVFPRFAVEQLECRIDDAGHKRYFTPTGRPVCGRMKRAANRKIPNEACLAQAMKNGACRMHGGASPGGPLKAGGRYSRVLGAWKQAFDLALQDRELLDTRRDLALMDGMIEKLLERVAAGDSPRWRADLERTYEELDGAVRSGRQREVGPLLKRLGEQIRAGAKFDAAVKDVMRHVDRRANTAHKINVLSAMREQKLTARDVAVAFAQLFELLRSQLGVQEYSRLVPQIQAMVKRSGAYVVGSAAEVNENDAAAAQLELLDQQAAGARGGSQLG